MTKQTVLALVFVLLNVVMLSDAFRLIEFELKPFTTTTFTCTDTIATSIENTAENCLVNHCAEYIADVAFSYSACTTGNTVSISGGATTVYTAGATLNETTLSVDQCIKNTLESDNCLAQLQLVIPNLSLIKFISDSFPEVPTAAPVITPVAAPVAAPTRRPTTSAPIQNPTTTVPVSSPTTTPSIASSLAPSFAPTLFTKPVVNVPNFTSAPTAAPISKAPLPSPVTSIAVVPTVIPTTKEDSSSRNAAFGAVLGLTAVTAILVGYFAYIQMQKRKATQKTSQEAIRPLDTTDTAYDDDVEMGKQPVMLPSTPELSKANRQFDGNDVDAASDSYLDSDRPYPFSEDDLDEDEEGESLVPEDDELSSGSSTLFDVNGRHDDEDGDSSVFYESPGEEDDEDEDGTDIEVTLEDTWDRGEDTTNLARDMEQEDDESVQGSIISSLGASADHYGGSPTPHQFMEWIKKSPLIPAAAKASVVAAVELESLERHSPPPSPVTVPIGPVVRKRTITDDASGWRSW
jgi:hypothetical protein